MINIIKNENSYQIKFFNQEYFFEIKDILKRNFFKWNKENKSWDGTKFNLNLVLPFLKEYDEIKNEEFWLKDSQTKINIEENNIRFNNNLLIKKAFKEYQIDGIKNLIKYTKHGLFDDTGLGKSFETICAINHLIFNNLIDKIFLVSFRATLYNWKKEFLKFSNFFKEDEIVILDKNLRNYFDTNDYESKKIIITDYITFKLISDYYYEKEKGKKSKNYLKSYIPFDKWIKNNGCLILDECQVVKNFSSQTSKKIKMITDNFKYRYILTATPHPNFLKAKDKEGKEYNIPNIEEVTSLFEVLDKDFFNKQNVLSCCNIGNRFSAYAINYVYYEKYLDYKKQLDKYITRRFKKDVFPELPPQNIKPIYIKMSELHYEIYKEFSEGIILKLVEEEGEMSVKRLKNKFNEICLITSDPILINLENKISDKLKLLLKKWNFENNNKNEICDDIISRVVEEKEKIIIWTYHPRTSDLLYNRYKKYNPVVLNGETKIDKDTSKALFVDNIIENFKNNDDIKIAIFNPMCLGVGVNLEFCIHSINYDRNFNYETYYQSLGRTYRATSIKESFVYNLIFDNTLDVYLDECLGIKNDVNFLKEKDDKIINVNELKNMLNGRNNDR